MSLQNSILETATARQFHAEIPEDTTTEKVLLGSILHMVSDHIPDKSRWSEVKRLIKPEDFFSIDHQQVFRAMLRIDRLGNHIDGQSLRDSMRSHGTLEDCGGESFICELIASAPHPVEMVQYAQIVRERSMVRQFISIGEEIVRRGTRGLGDSAAATILRVSGTLAKLSIQGQSHRVYSLEEVMQEVYEQKEKKIERGVPTGLQGLDDVIGGLRFGEKLIIGAKPGMGKSELVKQIGLNLAAAGIKFGIISVEERRDKIGENVFANISGVVNAKINRNDLDARDWKSLAQAMATTSGYQFKIVDSARKLSDIVAQAHILKADHGCQVIAVDHLHIVDGETNEHREREISRISAELKWVWKDLGVAGIECAQLNRKDGSERPNLASLRDSGSLEQDADVVVLLHRPDYYKTSNFDHVMEAIVAKNKHGPSAIVSLYHDGARQRVLSQSTGQEDPF